MARRFYVNQKTRGRRSSATPFIFERIIWGFFIVIFLILAFSLIWRHSAKETPEDAERVSNKIIRQIPRAQLEFADQGVRTHQERDAIVISLESSSQKESQPDNPTIAGDTVSSEGSEGGDSTPVESAFEGATTSNEPEKPPAAFAETAEDEHAAAAPVANASEDKTPGEATTNQTGNEPVGEATGDQSHSSKTGQSKEGKFVVRVGAFKSKANVEEICSRIEQLGYSTRTWEYDHSKLGHLYMVELVPFTDREEALKAKEAVEKQEHLQAGLIVKE